MAKADKDHPSRLLRLNKRLIEDARSLGHDQKNGQQLSDLELLAELQHFGAATFLLLDKKDKKKGCDCENHIPPMYSRGLRLLLSVSLSLLITLLIDFSLLLLVWISESTQSEYLKRDRRGVDYYYHDLFVHPDSRLYMLCRSWTYPFVSPPCYFAIHVIKQ